MSVHVQYLEVFVNNFQKRTMFYGEIRNIIPSSLSAPLCPLEIKRYACLIQRKNIAINQQLSFEINSPQYNSNSRPKVCSQSLIKTTYMYMHVAIKLSERYVGLLFLCVGRLQPSKQDLMSDTWAHYIEAVNQLVPTNMHFPVTDKGLGFLIIKRGEVQQRMSKI